MANEKQRKKRKEGIGKTRIGNFATLKHRVLVQASTNPQTSDAISFLQHLDGVLDISSLVGYSLIPIANVLRG